MLKIIDKAFAEVNRKGLGSFNPDSVKLDSTWQACGKIDWSKVPADDNSVIDTYLDDLKIKKACSPGGTLDGDATCLAIRATVKATAELQKAFPSGPAFHNAFITGWGQHDSWTTGAVEKIDLAGQPPSAVVKDPNGMNGYAMCNILRTILTQSANQQSSGSCSHLASLAAISHEAPAKAIEMSVRLFWTGRHTPQAQRPCDYIYQRQPGMVPFKPTKAGWVPSSTPASVTALNAECLKNKTCLGAGSRPIQPMGLAYMWQMASSSSESLDGFGLCAGSDRHDIGPVRYTGMPMAASEQSDNDLGGNPAGVAWACRRLVDPEKGSCEVWWGMKVCGSLSDEQCLIQMYTTMDKQTSEEWFTAVTAVYEEKFDDAQILTMLQAIVDRFPQTYEYWRRLVVPMSPPNTEYPAAFREWWNQMTKPTRKFDWHTPSGGQELLQNACKVPLSLMLVDATPLQWLFLYRDYGFTSFPPKTPFFLGQDVERGMKEVLKLPPWNRYNTNTDVKNLVDKMRRERSQAFGKCKHAVYLEKCDEQNDEYTLWTWGDRVTVSKAILLGDWISRPGYGRDDTKSFTSGIVCNVVGANQVSFAQLPTTAP